MKGNFKATTALALLGSTNITTPQVKEFGDKVVAEFEQIGRNEKMNAVRAILVGIGFHAMKAGLKHGEFTPWLKSKVSQANFWSAATAKLNASYYMRLAIAFVEESKPSKQELLALTAGGAITANLNTHSSPAKKLLDRIEKFVGERSLNEILIDEGIKGGGSGGGGGSTPTLVAGEGNLLSEIAEWLLALRTSTTDPEKLKRLSKRDLQALEKQVGDYHEDLRKAIEALSEK